MRLFIAIPVPEEVKKELIRIQGLLISSDKQKNELKYTIAKEFHLTLKFLGEVSESRLDKIKELLSKIKFCAFELSLDKINFFPNDKYIRVVWLGVKDYKKISNLQKDIEELLSQSHLFKKERKEFQPHFTLFRIKYIKDKEEFKNIVRGVKVNQTKFLADSFQLIKSTLTPKGPEYDVIERYKGVIN